MPQTFTTRDVELLGYANANARKNSTAYTIIDATAIAGVERVNAQFLYLKTRCTTADLRIAAAEVDAKISTHVVAPPSLPISDREIRSIVGSVASISSQRDLVWQKLGTIFNHYRASQSDLPVEEHFVSPRAVEKDVGATLLDRLVNYMSGRDRAEDHQLLVLSAHAGVGKTTVARYLTQQLMNRAARYKTLPLYIEAEHWRKLDLTRVDHLWDVFFTSLREVAPDLTLSERLLRHALQQGYVSFVFDGFDELCAHDSFDPVEVLRELAEIAAESEARILLTTRTLFWDARVTSVPENTRVWRMNSFNVQQAKDYFHKRLGDRSRRNTVALDLYSSLRRGSATPPERRGSVRAQFINLPLCVRMIADFVLDDGREVETSLDQPVIQRVLRAICRREIARQRLVTSEDNQLYALQDVATTYHDELNPQFGIEDLFLSVNGFSQIDQKKLVDHALLERSTHEGHAEKYQLRYDFLGPHLRAVAIARWILDEPIEKVPPDEILRIMEREADGKGHVLEQIAHFLTVDDIGQLTERIEHIPARTRQAASFLFHVSQALVGGLKEKSERTDALFFGGVSKGVRVVTGWTVRGLIEGLDLSGVRFVNCQFVDVMFKNCVSDDNTVFAVCTFEGDLRFDKEKAFGTVKLEDCRARYPADIAWGRVLKRESGDYSDSANEILRIALRKFWRNGRVKRTLRKADWKKGGLGRSNEAKRVLNVMLRAGLLQEIQISGADEGGIAFDDASIPDLQNYMDNQQLSGKIAVAHKALLESMTR